MVVRLPSLPLLQSLSRRWWHKIVLLTFLLLSINMLHQHHCTAAASSDMLIIRHGRSRVRHSTEKDHIRWGLKAFDNLTLDNDYDNDTMLSGNQSFFGNGSDILYPNTSAEKLYIFSTMDYQSVDKQSIQNNKLINNTTGGGGGVKKKIGKKQIMANIQKNVDKGLEYLKSHAHLNDENMNIEFEPTENVANDLLSHKNDNNELKTNRPSSMSIMPQTPKLVANVSNNNITILSKNNSDNIVAKKQFHAGNAFDILRNDTINNSPNNGTSSSVSKHLQHQHTIINNDLNKQFVGGYNNNAQTHKQKFNVNDDDNLNDEKFHHHDQHKWNNNNNENVGYENLLNDEEVHTLTQIQNNESNLNDAETIMFNNLHSSLSLSSLSSPSKSSTSAPSGDNNNEQIALHYDDVAANSYNGLHEKLSNKLMLNDNYNENDNFHTDNIVLDDDAAAAAHDNLVDNKDEQNGVVSADDETDEDIVNNSEIDGDNIRRPFMVDDYVDLEGLDETSRNNRLNLIKGQDVVTKFLQIVETQHLLGSNCTAGTALNLGEGVVDRYAQDRFRVEAEIAVNRANMLTRIFKLSAPAVQASVHLLHASVLSMVEFDDDIFAAGNCFDWNQHPVKHGLFCPFAYRLPYPDQDASLVKDLAAEYHYLGNTSEWFFLARKNAEKVIARDEQYIKAYHLYSNSTEREVDRILSVKYEDGRWSKPYYDCGGGNIWMLTYTVPFFGHDNGTYFFKGTSGIDIDLRRVDIDQCPQRHIPGTTQPLNIFAGTDKCKQRTTECEPIPGLGFRRGSYKCICRKGFYFPDTNSRQRYFNGSSLEEEYEKLMLLNEISTYNQANTYECLPCAEGCDSCKDASPCVAALNWPMRTSILVLACAVIGFLPPAAWFTFRYQQVKVLRAASPALLRVIALGAFFIYCTSIVMYPNPSIYTCTARVWLREIGFSLTYGALMLKTWRISVIFRVRSAKAVKITDASLLKRLGVLCGCIGVALLVRTIVAPPLVVVGKTADDLKAFLCKTDWWDHTFTSMEVLFLAWGVRLCIMVRKAPSEFNESRFISMAIYNEFLLTCFLNVSMLFLQSPANPDLLYIIFFCHTQLTVTLLLALIFGSKVYLVFRSGGKPSEDTIGLGAKSSGAKFICRSQARTLVNPSTATSSTAHLGANADTRLSEQEALEQIRQLCTQLQHLQDRAPPRGVAIATIATLLETCTTSHQLSLKPPTGPIKNSQQNAIRADKSTNTNIIADQLCHQIENGIARISITDDCDTHKIEDRNNLCVHHPHRQLQMNNCENQNSTNKQQDISCNDLEFQNLRLQCMCSSGVGGSCCEDEKFHGNTLPIIVEQQQHLVKNSSSPIHFRCSCNCAVNNSSSVHDKYSHLINDNVVSGSRGGCENIGVIDIDGSDCCNIKDMQKNRPPTESDQFNKILLCANCINNRDGGGGDVGTVVNDINDGNGAGDRCSVRNNLYKHQYQCNINLSEIKQCDGSFKDTNNQLTKVYLNNLSHVVYSSHMNASQPLDSLTKEPITFTTAITTKDGNEVNVKCDGLCNIIPHNIIRCNSIQKHNPNKVQRNTLNLCESIELSDDGVPLTPSPTISNISTSLNVISVCNSEPITTIDCGDGKKLPSKSFKVSSSSSSTPSSSSLPSIPMSSVIQQNQLPTLSSALSPSSVDNLPHCRDGQLQQQQQQNDEGDEKLSMLKDNNVGDMSGSSTALTATTTSSSSSTTSSTAPIASSSTVQQNQMPDDNNGGINASKRKKQPETKLVLDLNDRSKYTKEVSV